MDSIEAGATCAVYSVENESQTAEEAARNGSVSKDTKLNGSSHLEPFWSNMKRTGPL